MIPPPPRLVRRLVLDPVVVALASVVVVVSPLLAVAVAGPVALALRRRTPLALLWVAVTLTAREVLGVLLLTALWVGTGFGAAVRSAWSQRAHYRVMRWWADGVVDVAGRAVGLRVHLTRPELPEQPLVVLSRHAGTGDSLLLVHALLRLGRRPRLVVQAALQWDPCVDIVGHRVPTVFVPVQRERRGRVLGELERLAAGMQGCDALVIFPEGGNYSPARHVRAVRRLRELGRHRLADTAASLVHLLPPKTAGTLAVLRAAPEAPVLLAAHAGLDHLDSVRATVRNAPLTRPVLMFWRLVDRAEVPADDEARGRWLFARWQEMDAAISAVNAAEASPPADVGTPGGRNTPKRPPGVPTSPRGPVPR